MCFSSRIYRLFLLVVLFCTTLSSAYAAGNVLISALVGNAPALSVTTPIAANTGETQYIRSGTTKTFEFTATGGVVPDVSYTATPSAGSLSIGSGTGTSPFALPVQLTYLAPASTGNQTITLTLNDGTTIDSRIINLSIY